MLRPWLSKATALFSIRGRSRSLDLCFLVLSGYVRFLWLKVDRHAIDLSCEFERHIVIHTHRGAGILADIKGFHAHGESHGNGVLDPSLSDLPTIDKECSHPSLADAAAIVFKFK
jgi:hypothetical protein